MQNRMDNNDNSKKTPCVLIIAGWALVMNAGKRIFPFQTLVRRQATFKVFRLAPLPGRWFLMRDPVEGFRCASLLATFLGPCRADSRKETGYIQCLRGGLP